MIATINVAAGSDVFGIAITVKVKSSQPELNDFVTDVQCAVYAFRIIAAILCRDIAAEALFGFAGDDVDRAAGRITTVQGALRPTQYFYSFKIEKLVSGTKAERSEVQENASAIICCR